MMPVFKGNRAARAQGFCDTLGLQVRRAQLSDLSLTSPAMSWQPLERPSL